MFGTYDSTTDHLEHSKTENHELHTLTCDPHFPTLSSYVQACCAYKGQSNSYPFSFFHFLIVFGTNLIFTKETNALYYYSLNSRNVLSINNEQKLNRPRPDLTLHKVFFLMERANKGHTPPGAFRRSND